MIENNRYKLLKADINLTSILLILAYGIITYLVMVLLLPIFVVQLLGVGISESMTTILTLVAQFFICTPIALLILRAITGIKIKTMFKKTPNFATSFGKSLMIFCIVVFISMYVTQIISELISLANVESAMPDMIENPASVFEVAITAICVILIGPIAEEIIFRGFILNVLSRHNAWFAVIVSAFMFALYHCNIEQGVSAFILGTFLGITVIKTGSIWISSLLHIINNLTAFLFLLLPSQEKIVLIANLIYISTLFVVGMLGWFLYRKQFSLKNEPKEFSGRVCAKAVFTSPAVWVMVVIFSLLIVFSFVSIS